ncbi:BZ3500_MvSof-1268-A1-R1_Chr10-2g03006 [Microbotryum saponariae]|uniref:BZ3500_MvSof-1268-A1-R1_Chr10-2g03006 protein n=1 Tax=Microbotryum saponariae TaxID=289078 RepID=A0A2X0N9D1_9BASI|nr:BZ3501_MvSof-1269-A2-R1_Chr10-2g02592 [Microbotryum saponariae]SDA01916.1 BZ3500_MvSof-1268-A1-R1_Chr10-2g03006 [Microbotryum saponariae]
MSSKEGAKLKAEAEKALKPSWFGSQKSRNTAAEELYEQAGNRYKGEGYLNDAGFCYVKAGELARTNDERASAANHFWNACKVYKKQDPNLAVGALQNAIELYKSDNKFRQAADREKEMAAIWQAEGGNLNEALNAYERAARLYEAEDAQATANACLKEAAELAASVGEYPRAVTHFEAVAKHSLISALTRYSVKEYYLKAALCWLATGVSTCVDLDVVSTQRKLEEYCSQDPSFGATREAKFIHDIADAFEGGDTEGFTAAVADFDRLTRLDNWKTTILLVIKRQISEEPSLS